MANPGRAGTAAGQGTFANSINAARTIAGTYIDSQGVKHGFVRNASGSVTSFDAPNAGLAAGQGTIPAFTNTGGTVAGTYVDSSNTSRGFSRSTNGTIAEFDCPNSSTITYTLTVAFSVNASGVIAGFCPDSNGGMARLPADCLRSLGSVQDWDRKP